MAGILLHGGYLGGVFYSIHLGLSAGLAALIVGLQPLLTAFAAAPLLRAWGLRSEGRAASRDEVRAALARTGASAIEMTALPRGARKLADREIEEGGFGKGAALDEALDALAPDQGVAVRLDLGGQLAWINAGQPLVVALADPRDRAREVVALDLDAARGSISTAFSSSSCRRSTACSSSTTA